MTTHDPSKYKHKPSPKHTLEEVLKSLQDLIRNDLLDAKSAAGKPEPPPSADDSETQPGQPPRAGQPPVLERATPAREDFAPTMPASGPVNLSAVMRSLKDLIHNELDTGEEPAPAADAESETIEALPPPQESQRARPDAAETAPQEYTLEEFAPLAEELTLDATAEAVPVAPPSALPELPGKISPELIIEPEPESAPPVKIESGGAAKTTPGIQQDLPFDMPPAPAVEARLPPREPVPVSTAPSAPEPGATAEAVTPEIDNQAPAMASPVEPEAPLPTIEVEESFDATAYFETAPAAAETTIPEIQNAAVGAGETMLATEPAPPEAPPASETKTTLELATEPTVEPTLTMPTVDFDTIDLQSPPAEPSAPPPVDEAPSPESQPPVPNTEVSAPVAATTEMAASAPLAAETKTEPDAGAAQAATQDSVTPAPSVATAPEASAAPASPPVANPVPFNLDDIPVLKQVVAPPAGGTLQVVPPAPRGEPRRPSPDRTRDLVVRAVAKLNIEMRRSGGIGLDTKTILRLQQLIREELGKASEK